MRIGKPAATLASYFALAAFPATAGDCDSLAKVALPSATITTAQPVPAGSYTPPGQKAIENLPRFCRVAGVIKPSDDSTIQFETWMPIEGWNGKFQGIGNGGFAGSISYGGLADAVRNGYAAASTDTGHQAGGTNADWALGHPEKIVDFGHRAIHEMTVKGKAIVKAFYASAPKRSYFSSCSNGGRQALMEAQRYPADYDGIIAGAPANYWTHLMANAITNLQATDGPAKYIPAAKLPAIQAAALAACDAGDAVQDGVIENPAACRMAPDSLVCGADDSEGCLTAGQSKALGKLYDGMRDGHGNLMFPGYAPGGEAEQGGWEPWITGEAPEKGLLFAFGTNFYKSMVFSDSAWDYRTFHVDRDLKTTMRKAAPALNATDPDLSPFAARGGKLILYHGWSDAAIPGQNAVDYYESVTKKMGKQKSAEFVRLFMVPGMQHCGGGSGPNAFGQGGVAKGDPDSDIAAALEQWVERGIAPERIIATKYENGSETNRRVTRTRPLCAYPQVARYKGTGSTDDAANFECAVVPQPAGKQPGIR